MPQRGKAQHQVLVRLTGGGWVGLEAWVHTTRMPVTASES